MAKAKKTAKGKKPPGMKKPKSKPLARKSPRGSPKRTAAKPAKIQTVPPKKALTGGEKNPVPGIEMPKLQSVPKPLSEEPITPETIEAKPPEKAPMKTGIQPAFDLLPPWESKSVLSDYFAEEDIIFELQSAKSEASAFLANSGEVNQSFPGYFLIAAREGKEIVGAIDGFAIQGVLVIARSRAVGDNKRELHSLLYCAALSMFRDSKTVLFASSRSAFSEDVAGRLIFLGRSAGMQGIPSNHSDTLFFIRRIGKENDLVADGKELAALLRSAGTIFKPGELLSELGKQGAVQLIPLPTSPDSSSRLHELEDTVPALGIEAGEMDKILEKLKEDYVYDRKDITPESL